MAKMYLQYHKVFAFLLIIFTSFTYSHSKVQISNNFDQIYRTKKYDYNTSNSNLRILAQVNVSSGSQKVVSVDNFNAKGDGKKDDTKAFKQAWKKACSYKNGVLVVPKNKKYRVKPITFLGPCMSSLTMNIYGTIIASNNRTNYDKDRRHWIMFKNIHNFKVEGGGTIDGNGEIWWKNSCKINKNLPCTHAPTAVTFYNCKKLMVDNLRVQNGQQMHVSFQKCVYVRASSLMVTSPENSPNTDGIHVTNTQNIHIFKSTIKTGDDCISIVSGSKNVKATNIVCGPGHGISIGSLGADNSEAHVSDVFINKAKLTGTTNGVRIKTWQGGSGYARNIKFQNIEMKNVSNPIIINQNYCDQDEPCKEQGQAVQVKNVVYKNIKGTSESKVAIKFNCSKSYPCQGIVLQDINLIDQDVGKIAESSCENVRVAYIGEVAPKCS